MLSTWLQSKKDDEGFTLIELLVVVLIIGILAAIAIPVFLNQRENAWRSAVESDLRNAAIQVETINTRSGSFSAANGMKATDGGASAEVQGVTIQASEDVTVTVTATATEFTISGVHANLTAAEATADTLVYDSDGGGLANSTWG